jgi:hypothetical protein
VREAFHHGKWTKNLPCGNASKSKVLYQKRKPCICKSITVDGRANPCWHFVEHAVGTVIVRLLPRGDDTRLLHGFSAMWQHVILASLPVCVEEETRRASSSTSSPGSLHSSRSYLCPSLPGCVRHVQATRRAATAAAARLGRGACKCEQRGGRLPREMLRFAGGLQACSPAAPRRGRVAALASPRRCAASAPQANETRRSHQEAVDAPFGRRE